jgi:ABC-type glycerol-3-phosphate transport system permease component
VAPSTITFPISAACCCWRSVRTIEAFKLFDVVFLLTEAGRHLDQTIAVTSTASRSSVPHHQSTALPHPAVHRDRADQPLSCFVNRRVARPDTMAATERALGEAGSGQDRVRRRDQPDLLLPSAVDHSDRVQDPQRRARDPPKWLFTPTSELRPVFSRLQRDAQAVDTGFDLFFFNSIFIAGTSVLLALLIGTLAATASRATRCAATTPICSSS